MRAYDRAETKSNGSRLTAEQTIELPLLQTPPPAKCNGACLRTLSPFESLLLVHPAPWNCLPSQTWVGKEPPDPVILDDKGFVVDWIEDPAHRPAIVQAVNTAAAMLAGFDERCDGAQPRAGSKAV